MIDTLDSPPTNANVQYAFKQISPEKAGVLATLSFAGTSFPMRNLASRTTNLRFEAEWFNQGGDLGSLDLQYFRLDGDVGLQRLGPPQPLWRPPGVANDNQKMTRRDNRNLSHPYEVFWKGSAVGQTQVSILLKKQEKNRQEQMRTWAIWSPQRPAQGGLE